MIVCIDMETAGLEFQHPTIQIAAVAVQRGVEIDSFERKLQFKMEDATEEALKMNHYDPAVWETEAVPPFHAISALSGFFKKYADVMRQGKNGDSYKTCRVMGHNIAKFDMPRLWRQSKAMNIWLGADGHVLDTYHLACWVGILTGDPHESLTLDALCQRYGIDRLNGHSALADVRDAVEVARRLVTVLRHNVQPEGGTP